MASQTHGSARAESAARRGEYAHFEHKLRERWCELRDETREALSRSENEIHAVERALKRIELGTYGTCVSCGQPIERERLEAYPTANRCAACQRAYEHHHATTPTPRL
jgi:RNA polymerase-binding transcription factor DksA